MIQTFLDLNYQIINLKISIKDKIKKFEKVIYIDMITLIDYISREKINQVLEQNSNGNKIANQNSYLLNFNHVFNQFFNYLKKQILKIIKIY